MSTTLEFDLVVYGATPAGVACAVRAARSGLHCLIVSHTPVLGGMLSNGLCVWDTLYEGFRAPFYNEIRRAIIDHYRTEYGEDSEEYRFCLPRPGGHHAGNFEASVARQVILASVEAESRITCLTRHYPVAAEVSDRLIHTVVFSSLGEENEQTSVTARTFADASYEGDLVAAAGCEFAVGREARHEYGEPHAGKVYMKSIEQPADDRSARLASLHDRLNLRRLSGYQVEIDAPDSGAGDDRVQAYNYRMTLTDDPRRRVPPMIPDSYDRSHVDGWESNWDMPAFPDRYDIPNRNAWVNRPQLPDLQSEYPMADWRKRHEIMDAHWQALREYLYFLSTDAEVTPEIRKIMASAGIPNDQYPENGHRPYEIYVREARRLAGRYVFTEHDVTLNETTRHTPFHADAVSATDWYVDVHACSTARYEDSEFEGTLKLRKETFPAQIPFRSLLPGSLENLLVLCCVSSSHIGFSAVRVEPTWMVVGESAGIAAALASSSGRNVAAVDSQRLLKEIVENRIMVSFLNDVDPGCNEPWVPAVQFFGTRGFFPGYDARPFEPVDAHTARQWIDEAHRIRSGFDAQTEADAAADDLAKRLSDPSKTDARLLVNSSLAAASRDAGLPEALAQDIASSEVPVNRGRFCDVLYSWVFAC